MSKSPISKRLKEARITAGFSQKSLGIAAGIDQFSASARMNQYEAGKHVPDYLVLTRIAKILELPTAYFYVEGDELAELVKIFDSLKKSEKIAILKKLKHTKKKLYFDK